MKIGIVGCGKIAQVHATVLKNIIRNSTLFFCDRNKHKADNLAARFFPGSTYTSIDELLSNEKLDTVHILTQVQYHKALAKKVLEAGIHVYVEKPVTETASEYNSLLALAKSKNKHLYAGYSTLGYPPVQRAKNIIISEKFGKLITVHCEWNRRVPYGPKDHWAYSLKGGILQNIADHPTSIIVDVLDEIHNYEVLFGRRVPLQNNLPDLMHVSVSNDHQIGSYTISFGHGNTHAQVVYSLEAATIIVDFKRNLITLMPDRGPESSVRRILSGLKLSWDIDRGTVVNIANILIGIRHRHQEIVEVIKNFYSVIDGDQTVIVSDKTAAQIMTLLEQVWEEMDS
jgi:predicted dehydrogenase